MHENWLCGYFLGLWIQIRIGSGFSDFVDPDPYWESGLRVRIQGQENLRNFIGKMQQTNNKTKKFATKKV
jgi:hypothetical protein